MVPSTNLLLVEVGEKLFVFDNEEKKKISRYGEPLFI